MAANSPPTTPIATGRQDDIPRRRETRLVPIVCLLFFALSLGLYLVRLGHPPRYMYDEAYHAYTAQELVKGNRSAYWYEDGNVMVVNGQELHTTWTHPPLSRDIIQIGIHLFGDNTFGWRVMSAVFGAIGVVALFLLANLLFNFRIALFAAGLLLFDCLWFVQSRIAMLDIFLATFLLLAYLAFAAYLLREKGRHGFLVLTGLALGLALATKWSAIYSCVFLAGWVLWREGSLARREKSVLSSFAFTVLAFVCPAILYTSSYAQFFAMGYNWSQWCQLQVHMWGYHTGLKEGHEWASSWWTWPLILKPVWYHAGATAIQIEQVFAMGNPALWWLFVPVVGWVGWRWKGNRFDSRHGLLLLGFFGNWLPWALSPRVAFIYHFLPSVPFGCLAIALALHALEEKRRHVIVWLYCLAVFFSFEYFYPHVASLMVSKPYSNSHYWLPSWMPDQPDPTAPD